MKRVSEKSVKRLENKKRKIQSFIELIDQNGVQNEEQPSSRCDHTSDVFDSNFKMMSELRKKLAVKHEKERPKIFVDDRYLLAQNNGLPPECLTLEDIQDFVLATLMPPPRLSSPPTWCKVHKPTRASKVAIFGIDFDISEDAFSDLNFKHSVQFEAQEDWIENLLAMRLSNRQLDKMHKEMKNNNSEEILISDEEKFGRTKLLLSPLMMVIEKYPMINDSKYVEFRTTKQKYIEVTDSSPMFAIDCEMCYTMADKLEVTRISVVNEKCEVIYDTLVKPKNEIKDYLTRYSGITKKLLIGVDVTLTDVHKELDRILPEDAILCGQSLNSDLQALELIHPYVIDTSIIYNLSGYRPTKASLKHLARHFLKMDIQMTDTKGHNSAEDAMASMKLVKLKLSMGMEFGDRVLAKNTPFYDSLSNHTMSLTSYLERHDIKLNVFYDYSDIDNTEKSFVIYRNHSLDLLDAIGRVLHKDKAICIVIQRNGKCFIKF